MAYDIIIIGAGPSGLTTAIYAGRAKMNALLISDSLPGGHAMLTEEIENYPGFPRFIKGPELIENMYAQAKNLNIEFKKAEVGSVRKKDKKILVKTGEGDFEALSVIIATGTTYKKLGVKGEEAFIGKGVSYCGVCDAPLFRNKEVAVIGGGDTAVYEASHLLRFCSGLHLVHRRDTLRATKIIQIKVLENKKTHTYWNSVVEEIYGGKLVEGIKIKDVTTGKITDIPCKGVFVFVGITPNSEIVKDILKRDETGYILTDDAMKTSLDGAFACGDVRKKILRQISTAVGDGATAAFAAQKYVEELKGIAYNDKNLPG